MSLKYWLIVIVLGIGWGTSFLFNAILLREIGPLTISLGRVALGAAGCWAYAVALRKPVRLSWRLAGGMLVLGAFNFALPFAIFPVAQQYIASGVAGIVNALMPIMVVLVSHVWPGGEKATLAKSLGVAFGFSGIVILALPALRGGGSEFWAILFTLLAPLSYAIATNLARRYKDIEPTIVAAMALTGGTVFMAPLAIGVEGWPVINHAETWAALAVTGLVLTSASFIAFYWLLPRIGGTNTSTVTFIAPVSAVVLGVFVLNEVLRPEHIFGMLAILAALLVIDGRLAKRLTRKQNQPIG